jgi:drug/metabolite transporter (DMT)-like permease
VIHPAALPAIALGVAGIAAGTVLVRFSEVGPLATAFWRLALAWPVLAALAMATRAGPAPLRGSALVGVCFGIDLAFYHLAIGLTTVANACLLSNLAPVVVTLVAVALGWGRRGWATWAALAVALAGALLLTRGSGHGGEARLLGDLFGILSALAYAAYQLAANRIRRDGADTLRTMAHAALAGALMLLPLALLRGETVLPATREGWLVVIAMALVAQALGQTLIVWSLAHLAPGFSSLTLLGQPALVAVVAWPLFAEPLSALQIAGAAVLLAGVCWARQVHASDAQEIRTIKPDPAL